MAKEATNIKPSKEREWYCLAVHENTCKRTFEYAGAENRLPKRLEFVAFILLFFLLLILSHPKLLTSIAYKLQAQSDITFIVVATFILFVCKLATVVFWFASVLRSSDEAIFEQHTRSRFKRMPIAHAQFTCAIGIFYIEWYNIINGNRTKYQSSLLRGIHRFWSRSIITTILFPFCPQLINVRCELGERYTGNMQTRDPGLSQWDLDNRTCS